MTQIKVKRLRFWIHFEYHYTIKDIICKSEDASQVKEHLPPHVMHSINPADCLNEIDDIHLEFSCRLRQKDADFPKRKQIQMAKKI